VTITEVNFVEPWEDLVFWNIPAIESGNFGTRLQVIACNIALVGDELLFF
jgi:hypothetical protein